MQNAEEKDSYKLSRIFYAIEAMLEYFVTIAVGTVYLARITKYVGISDEITAILTSFITLGCSFQLLSIFFGNRSSVKRFVTVGDIASQALFTLLYIIPLLGISTGIKAVFLVVSLLMAHIVRNLVNAPKINWFMSMVRDGDRGRFTALKEIVSLIGGAIFSYLLSFIIDRYEAQGNLRTAFIIGAAILGSLTVLHTLPLLFSKEPKHKTPPVKEHNYKRLFKNKILWKLILVSVFWNIANYATASFSGTYMNNELGFSMTFSASVVLICNAFRIVFSVPFGKFADKKGFCSLVLTCCLIAGAGYALNVFTVPSNGKVFYFVHYALYSIAMAGANSAMINLIYDYISKEDCAGALALNYAISGIAGFLITVALSPVMSLMQGKGNRLFGRTIYSQQIFSLFSFLFTLIAIIYLLQVIRKLPRVKRNTETAEDSNEIAEPTVAGEGNMEIEQIALDGRITEQRNSKIAK